MFLLEALSKAFGPSGREDGVRELIREAAAPFADELYTDALGNLIVHKKGPGMKLMLMAHMDEIGFIVTAADDKGFLRVSQVGGIDKKAVPYSTIRFENGVQGVLSYPEKVKAGELKLTDLFVDIGGVDKEAALSMVGVGEMGVVLSEYTETEELIRGRAMDDRAGCAVLLEVLKETEKSAYDLYFVFTVQEEVGLRGARTAAFSIEPDAAIAVDVTDAYDTPGSEEGAVVLHGGPAVKIKDSGIISHPRVRDHLIETAKRENIPYQMEVLRAGSTDVGAVHVSRGGVMGGGLSIPARYIHTGVETVSKKDLLGAVRLLVAALSRAL